MHILYIIMMSMQFFAQYKKLLTSLAYLALKSGQNHTHHSCSSFFLECTAKGGYIYTSLTVQTTFLVVQVGAVSYHGEKKHW